MILPFFPACPRDRSKEGAARDRRLSPAPYAILGFAVNPAQVRQPPADRAAVARDLAGLLGGARVFTHPADLLAYEYDGSVLSAVPDLVVFPESTAETAEVVRIARRHRVPVVARGSGTGLAGGAITPVGGIIVSLARMRRILRIDLDNRCAVVQPGVINLDVTRAVEAEGYFYAPDPSSQSACSIGGNVANNSGGVHTLAFGVTTNHVLGLTVVLADGSVERLGGRGPDEPGLDLVGLLVGSEGTLGIVTEVTVRLMRRREGVRTMLGIFDSIEDASRAVADIIASGIAPTSLEMIDQLTVQAVEPAVRAGFPLDAGAVLLIEVEGVNEALPTAARVVEDRCAAQGAREVRTAQSEEERHLYWAGRKGAFGAMGRLAPNYYLHDAVVPRSQLPAIMRRILEIARRHGIRVANVFHAGDGNLHPLIPYDAAAPGETERVLRASEEMLAACVAAGGSLSGEHGIGIEKNNYMPWVFSDADLDAQRRLKRALDPEDLMNPSKIFPTPITCGELMTRPAPRLAASGLWI
jgi:glycolate oxidase